MLNGKIPSANRISDLCLMQINRNINLLYYGLYLRIIPPFYLPLIESHAVYAVITLDKIKAARKRIAILDTKGFSLIIWQ